MVKAVVGANWGDEGKGKIHGHAGQGSRHYHPIPGRVRTQDTRLSLTIANLRFTPFRPVFLQTYDEHYRKRRCIEHSGIYQ